jgi:hypothetical protein
MKGKVVASDKHAVNEAVLPTVVYGWDDLESL